MLKRRGLLIAAVALAAVGVALIIVGYQMHDVFQKAALEAATEARFMVNGNTPVELIQYRRDVAQRWLVATYFGYGFVALAILLPVALLVTRPEHEKS